MSVIDISSETRLARLALDLGASHVGGALSSAEQQLVAQAVLEPPLPLAAVEAVRRQMQNGVDVLGDIFLALRPARQRRDQGQFMTPDTLLEPMLGWALAQQPQRLIDPGSGSGRFLAAALRLEPRLSVIGIDSDPLAALMTRATLAVLEAVDCRVMCANYLTVSLPEIAGRSAFVGNPPYVRHHDLSATDKDWALQAARLLGYRISGLAGLHALFFLATALHARPNDIGCLVTSSEWLDVGYGAIVRKLLLERLGLRSLDLIDARAVPFEEAMTTALISSFEVGRQSESVVLKLVAKASDLANLENGTSVPAAALAGSSRWSPFFRGEAPPGDDAPTLSSLVRVHRGTATGSNKFFVMTPQEAAERGLTAFCRPVISSGAQILSANGDLRATPERKVLLDLPADLNRAAHPAVDAYLRQGEAAGIDQTYLCSHRKPWWRVSAGAPPIVVSYMARQAPRFALNSDGMALLNIGHGLYPKRAMSEDELHTLVTALNAGREAMAGSGRTYHGGLEKFEPREMESLPLPAGISVS